MKAYVYTSYGPPEKVLQPKELEKPAPAANEVLIKVVTTTVNDYDWGMVTGKPLVYRLIFGLFKPKFSVPGMELAGIIHAVGINVKGFKVGDDVYGDISEKGFGTFAEYVCVHENGIAKMPKGMDYIQAAALPHAGLLALQALEMAKLEEGQKILVNGAGGGVGTLALQLCKLKNCEVTGVDSGEKLGEMQQQGFDYVLDYKKEDFTKNGIRYDVILDCKTHKSAFSYVKSLAPKGTYVTVGGRIGRLLSLAVWSKISSLFTSKKLQILTLKPNKGLERIGELFVQNKLKCLIDGPYPFEELPHLIQHFGESKHQGKIVVRVAN
ncbi:NAD(P)-dependent alcohol dehydrogenase [Flagellimonas sp. S3867]|uniref:NAD(P)-dependent alcohol dehydrogenase n=1 Tax=Flagellimonas sp. S3867 TaxID=2768063 RepID=UPI0016859EB5|nr:NAD(P)-dependent alcohol dehydrogenase [Flagellimonas sp. S3867]